MQILDGGASILWSPSPHCAQVPENPTGRMQRLTDGSWCLAGSVQILLSWQAGYHYHHRALCLARLNWMLTGRLSRQTDDRWIEDDAFCTSALLVFFCVFAPDFLHTTRSGPHKLITGMTRWHRECLRLYSYCAVGHTVPDAGCDVFAYIVLPRSSVAPHHPPQAPTFRPLCLFPPSAAEVVACPLLSLDL